MGWLVARAGVCWLDAPARRKGARRASTAPVKSRADGAGSAGQSLEYLLGTRHGRDGAVAGR